MSFAQSPQPEVVNLGSRIIRIRVELSRAGWDTAALDAALKLLTDDSGNVAIPNGVTETADAMREVFERLPQVMREAHSLYEKEYLKLAPTQPAAAPALFRLHLNNGLGFETDMVDGENHAFTDEIGGPASTQTFTIFNDGGSDLTITDVTVGGDVQTDGGPPANAWGGVLPAVPFVIPGGGSIDIPFDFYAGGNPSPVPAGIYNMSLNIQHDAGDEPSPFSVSLTGDSNAPAF